MRFPTGRGFALTVTTVGVLATLLGGCTGDRETAAGTSATVAPTAVAGSPAASPSASAVTLRPLDRRVLRELAANGDDRSCPHDLENELRVGRTSDAAALAKDFSGPDAFVRVADNTTGPGSLVIVELHFVPTDAAIAAMTRRMLREAKRRHGRYDRWETTPVTKC